MTQKRNRYYVQLYKDSSLTGDLIYLATQPVKGKGYGYVSKRLLGPLLGPFLTKRAAVFVEKQWDGEGDMTVKLAEILAKTRQDAKGKS